MVARIVGRTVSSGAPYASDPFCFTGEDNFTSEEYRCAFEFDISALPAGATITAATLSLRTNFGNFFCAGGRCLIDVAGYVGNGTGELADLTAGSTLLTFGPTTADREGHDVTAFVTGLYAAADDWAGFRLSRAAASIAGDFLFWDPPENDVPPLLIIEYSLPDLDADNDGVANADDLCPGTALPDADPAQWKKNRYAANASGAFVDVKGADSGITVADTGGCSGAQIIAAAGLGDGHTKSGISGSALAAWVASH